MERIRFDGEQLSAQTATVERYGQTHEIALRVLRDHDEDELLVEQHYEHATVVSVFDVLNESSVRGRTPIERDPECVRKAVYAVGFANIHDPDWSA